jgi:7,8-dihydropterin-6-yl-methyl-4-(beta-D-ribofuranosyl)aminobenzene 5'-phosphate synthase
MIVTTLIENRPSETDPQLQAEWGCALHIKFNGTSLLFDTGRSGKSMDNATRLGIDIANVDAAILSHHHIDHTGGLRRFLEINSSAKVHLGPTPNGDIFITGFLQSVTKYAGIDKKLRRDYPGRFNTIDTSTEILPNVFVIPQIMGPYPVPVWNKRLVIVKNGQVSLDNFAHEIVLAIKEDDGLVVFTGCSHHGLLNMVDTAAKLLPGVPVKAVIGGFHLCDSVPCQYMACTKSEVEDLGKEVLEFPVNQTYSVHCTGERAFNVFKEVMGDHLADLRTGDQLEI